MQEFQTVMFSEKGSYSCKVLICHKNLPHRVHVDRSESIKGKYYSTRNKSWIYLVWMFASVEEVPELDQGLLRHSQGELAFQTECCSPEFAHSLRLIVWLPADGIK